MWIRLVPSPPPRARSMCFQKTHAKTRGARARRKTNVESNVDKVLEAKSILPELENLQVPIQLLQSCLSVRKLNHVLRTIPGHLLLNSFLVLILASDNHIHYVK